MPHTTNKFSSRITMNMLMVFACAVGFSAAYRMTANAHGDDEAAVRDTLLKSALGFEKNDLALLTKVWANDESLTVFESGHANYGWAATVYAPLDVASGWCAALYRHLDLRSWATAGAGWQAALPSIDLVDQIASRKPL